MNGTERPFLRQTLRHVIAFHWQIGWDQIRRRVPAELDPLEVDGHYWVSLVATEVAEVQLTSPLPLPSIPPFRQLELRTPVSAGGLSGTRHLSLDVSSSTLAAALRTMMGIDGKRADIRLDVEGAEEPRVLLVAKRETGDPISCSIESIASGVSREMSRDSFEWQLLAPTRIFTGALGSVQVVDATVPELRARKAKVARLDESFLWAAGLTRPTEEPLTHYLQEVQIGLTAPSGLRP